MLIMIDYANEPAKRDTPRWHQDYFYNWGPKDSCTVYIPMKTKKKMGTCIGSGRISLANYPIANVVSLRKWKSIPNDYIDNLENKVEIDLDQGDVLFFHSLLAHTPQVNTSTKRGSNELRYQNMRDKKFWKTGGNSHNEIARNALEEKLMKLVRESKNQSQADLTI